MKKIIAILLCGILFFINSLSVSAYHQSYTNNDSNVFVVILVVLIISLIIGFVYISSLKKQMTNIESGKVACEYIEQGSFKLTRSNEVFLYSRVTKIPRPKNNQGGHHGGPRGRR